MNYQKYLNAAEVPENLQQQALDYLTDCDEAKKAHRILLHTLTAWIVVGWLLITRQVPWNAESLPRKWWKYDNDVSINGDRGVWLMSSDGYAEIQPCPLDDSAMQYSYYSKSHQRSKWARWIWLGFRNMASKLSFEAGPYITPEMRPRLRQFGDLATDRDHPGLLVSELDGHWCIYSITKLPFGFVIRRNVGVKLGLAVNGLRRKASLVMIKFSVIRGK